MVELEHPKDLNELLRQCAETHASSLMLKPGLPPILRIQGQLLPTKYAKLTPEETVTLSKPAVTEDLWAQFEAQGELEFEYAVEAGGFVVNLFRSLGQVSVVANSTVIARPAPPPMEDMKAVFPTTYSTPGVAEVPVRQSEDDGEAAAATPAVALPTGPRRSGSAAKPPPTHPRADEDMNRW
jgi:hypothetical protein